MLQSETFLIQRGLTNVLVYLYTFEDPHVFPIGPGYNIPSSHECPQYVTLKFVLTNIEIKEHTEKPGPSRTGNRDDLEVHKREKRAADEGRKGGV